jgi:hypothetical protein
LISSNNCGVNEKLIQTDAQAADNKQMYCCESLRDFLNQELYIDENPRVFELWENFSTILKVVLIQLLNR